jgi:hypothetical protein
MLETRDEEQLSHLVCAPALLYSQVANATASSITLSTT